MTFWWCSATPGQGSVPTHISSSTCAMGAGDPKRDLEKIFHVEHVEHSGFRQFYDFLEQISLFQMFQITLRAPSKNIRTISKAVSLGVINYFSLLSEQMSLRWAVLISSRDWKKKCSLEGWNMDLETKNKLQASFSLVNRAKSIQTNTFSWGWCEGTFPFSHSLSCSK